MSENENTNGMPNQNSDLGQQPVDYLKAAANACTAGDLVLGMHLYLAAYEKAVADPSIPDGMSLAGLREAWSLACQLKERSMAEYVFEKMEPYLTGEEIAECANKLQNLALDRLEEYGFSREELENMAQMISQDFMGDSSVVKVESISIPNAGMFGVPNVEVLPADDGEEAPDWDAVVDVSGDDLPESEAGYVADAPDRVEEFDESSDAADEAGEPDDAVDEADGAAGEPDGAADEADGAADEADGDFDKPGKKKPVMLAPVDDFNPYDQYAENSVGTSWHSVTNEGSGSYVFTLDEDRAHALEKYNEKKAEASAATRESDADEKAEAADGAALAEPAKAPIAHSVPQAPSKPESDSLPTVPAVSGNPSVPLSYRNLAGYAEAVSLMREIGIGMQADPAYNEFVKMLNRQHGLGRAPSLDTLLFRAPVLEDATRFVDATAGEIDLPVLRMSMEEGVQGVPMLCVIVQGDRRPRMNHAHNRFEAPAILILDDLDTWAMPQAPETVDSISGFVMANISRGAREAVNLIRSAVEDPDVYVLATATMTGNVDPFFYDLLEPITVVDIGNPSKRDRSEIWLEIARDHPSMRGLDRSLLVKLSNGLPRYDIYMAAREAVEEAYKAGLRQRGFVPVTPQNILEKLAACQPLDSEEYHALEDEVVRDFRNDLENLDALLGGSGE